MEALVVALLVYDGPRQRERRFRDMLDPMDVPEEKLLRHYRFPRHEILALCQELEPFLKRPTQRCHALPVHTQVLTALRFYASGSFQNVVADTTGIHQSSVSRSITMVTEALYRKAVREIKMPNGMNNITQAKQKFYDMHGIPRVIGAIDCTHIPIKGPAADEHLYVNRKGFHSLNVQAVCSTDHLILNCLARYPGCSHDSFIWANSHLRHLFDRGDFGDSILIGDGGYAVEPHLYSPVAHPITAGDRRYNQSHRKTRVVIEKTFGILKSRFRCLHSSGGSLQYEPTKCSKITMACMLLHNLCIRRGIPLQELLREEQDENDDYILPNNERTPGWVQRREMIQRYFD